MRLLSTLFLLLVSAAAAAQSWPAKPVHIVVAYPPGGGIDVLARQIGDKLSSAWGQPVIVENKPGANTILAADTVAKAAPDGYTVLMTSDATFSINPHLYKKLPYDRQKSFAPVTMLVLLQQLLVANPSLPANTLGELIAYAKKNPGKLNYASSGNGSAPHMAAVLFQRVAGVEMVHVPFKGGAPAVQSVVAGDTQLSFATPPSVLSLVQAGRLKALAVTSRETTPLVPGVPGMVQAGLPDYEISFWYGFFVPAGTPAEAVKKLFDATTQALKAPQTPKALAPHGTEASGSASPADFAAFLAEDAKLWARLVKESGAKIE
jgi:tripartite-type tricarboxylate transporter receptor subunit TctC